MRARLPKFLVPRRKYEVDESMTIVKIGRSKILPAVRLTQRELTPVSREMIVLGHGAWATTSRQLPKVILLFQWGRMPRPWELSFVAKMKEAESQGIPFPEVLQTNLPVVLGEAPSEVLLRWVGKKARSQPKHFAKVVAKMFGPSGKRIIVGLEKTFSPQDMLQTHEEPDEPFQALFDAIERSDATKPNRPKSLDKNRWKNLSG